MNHHLTQPYLSKILIYPLKSFDPVTINQSKILANSPLQFDREYALIDDQGKFINGKRNSKVHQIRSNFDLESNSISLKIEGLSETVTFNLEQQKSELEAWFSDYFHQDVTLIQNKTSGFPDDPEASGPTIISTATLQEVASWFPNITVEEMRLRFRANLEIDGVVAFWEDRLFSGKNQTVTFQIGDVLLEGINPCQRCIVPTRNPFTGEVTPDFQRIFNQKRQATLPNWVNSDRFNHFYRLSVNTKIPVSQAGKTLKIGDYLDLKPVFSHSLTAISN
jgi:uncharacterized protein YcbX